MKTLSQIDTFVFDLDGTFYPFKLSENGISFFQISDETIAEVAYAAFPNIPVCKESLLKIINAGYIKHSNCYSAFTDAAREWPGFENTPPENIRDALFSPYHTALFKRLKKEIPQAFEHAARAGPHFEALDGQIRSAILTHGCRDAFAIPYLQEAGIHPHFEAVFGMAEFNFHNKGKTVIPLGRLLRHLDADPARTAFVEDSLRNLWVAKAAFPEITTIYIHHGIPLTPKPPWVDFQMENVSEILAQKAEHPAQSPYPLSCKI